MGALFQASAEVKDWDRFRSAIDWLRQGVGHPDGFISLRVFRDTADSSRVTIVEEWSTEQAFRTSLRESGPTAGKEFASRAGVEATDFQMVLWGSADVAPIGDMSGLADSGRVTAERVSASPSAAPGNGGRRDGVLLHRIVTLAGSVPDRLAMVDLDGRSRSYADVLAAVARWAAAFRRLGVGRGQTVVTMLPNSFEAYDAWLGLSWLGAIEVPANNMYRGEMLRYLVDNSQAEVVIISRRFASRLVPILPDLPRVRAVVVPDSIAELQDLPVRVVAGADFLTDTSVDLEGPGPEIHDVSAMVYTSGTTGPSKGVLVPWGELAEATRFVPEGFVEEEDPYFSAFPPFHLGGKAALCTALNAGGHIILRETFSVTEFWNDMRRHGVRAAGLLGPMVAMLLATPPRADDADNPLESVLTAPVIATIDEFQRRFGIGRVASGFAMTEIGFPLSTGWAAPNTRTCGRVREGAPHYELKVVDQHDEEVGPGQVGELVVRTRDPWVMNVGYWQMPEATAAAWRNGWFHTGDAFTYDDDGWFYFVDRIKDALRRRGENISSFEVEAGINEHPAVRESAVIGVPSELGEEDVKAVIVLREGQELRAEELMEFLVPRMPRFMIPRYVEFVPDLPKTDATMRTRKVELRAAPINADTWDRQASGWDLPRE